MEKENDLMRLLKKKLLADSEGKDALGDGQDGFGGGEVIFGSGEDIERSWLQRFFRQISRERPRGAMQAEKASAAQVKNISDTNTFIASGVNLLCFLHFNVL